MAIMQVTTSVAFLQVLSWYFVLLEMGVSVAIMQVVFSAVYYA